MAGRGWASWIRCATKYSESRLFIPAEYERLALVWRLAEMLIAGMDEPRAVKVRAQYGVVDGWDDIAEWQVHGGELVELRWQVKRQLTPLLAESFDALVRGLEAGEFRACLLVPGSFEVKGVGSLQALSELLRRRRNPGAAVEEIGWDTSKELVTWRDHLSRVVDAAELDRVLARLDIRYAGDERDLEERALRTLRVLFSDPSAAVAALVRYVGPRRDPAKDFTAEELISGPLAGLARCGAPWSGHAVDLSRFAEAARRRYRDLPERVALPIVVDGHAVDLPTLPALLREHGVLNLVGDGGAGKSLLVRHLAILLLDGGSLPLVAQGSRGFSGVASWLDEAARVFGALSFDALARAARSAGRELVVLLDGLDREGGEEAACDAQVLASAAGAPLLVSARRGLIPEALTARLPPLSQADRRRLWVHWTGAEPGPEEMVTLQALRSPIDLHLASEARGRLADPTRHQIIAAVVEGRRVSTECLRRLEQCAEEFARRFVSTVRAGDLRRADILPSDSAGLLEIEDGWASFSHDVIQVHFLAEHLLTTHRDPSALARAVTHPRCEGVMEQLLGADLEDRLLNELLDAVADTAVARQILDGAFGMRVAELARKRQDRLFDDAFDELGRLQRHLAAGGTLEDFSTLPAFATTLLWLRLEQPWDGALARETARLVRRLDEVALVECDADTADERFRQFYVWSGGRNLFAAKIGGAALRAGKDLRPPLDWTFRDHFVAPPRSPGLLAIALNWGRLGEPPTWTVEVIEAAWQTGIYNAQLEALDLVRSVYASLGVDDAKRIRAFMGAIRPHPWLLSMTHLEVLVAIGVEEQPQLCSEEDALAALRALARDPEQTGAAERAAWYWDLQFEDFGSDCFGAFEALEPEELVTVLCLVAFGLSPERAAFFEPVLLERICKLKDPRTESALRRWASSPPRQGLSINATEECWLLANLGLLALGLGPDMSTPGSPGAAAWSALARLVAQSTSAGEASQDEIVRCWDTWRDIDPLVTVDALLRFNHSLSHSNHLRGFGLPHIDLVRGHEERVRRLLCRALDAGLLEPESDFRVWPWGLFRLMEQVADAEIADRLVRLVDHPSLGHKAARIVKGVHGGRRGAPG